ncbi:helix-turn-helix domain-containing protein [Lamprobacter modestohalophilus]|uniref:helix-turn-helix domain-containing protein n=1 Tax=Lamprobacter modestohalophilus TaxID=1064514 RepID=UPI002ADEE235|nr:helix-turn-helix transcriptional regulator [Lamprobacter modestohalophilus]
MAMTHDELKAACKRRGFTLGEFADEFGVARSTAYQWGNRTGVPRWARIILTWMEQHGLTAEHIRQR